MVRVIDMECSIPKPDGGETPAAPTAPEPERPGYGMANYSRIFRARREGTERPATEMDAFVTSLRDAGIVRAVPFGVSNDELSGLLRDHPGMFIGLARISALKGMAGV